MDRIQLTRHGEKDQQVVLSDSRIKNIDNDQWSSLGLTLKVAKDECFKVRGTCLLYRRVRMNLLVTAETNATTDKGSELLHV